MLNKSILDQFRLQAKSNYLNDMAKFWIDIPFLTKLRNVSKYPSAGGAGKEMIHDYWFFKFRNL